MNTSSIKFYDKPKKVSDKIDNVKSLGDIDSIVECHIYTCTNPAATIYSNDIIYFGYCERHSKDVGKPFKKIKEVNMKIKTKVVNSLHDLHKIDGCYAFDCQNPAHNIYDGNGFYFGYCKKHSEVTGATLKLVGPALVVPVSSFYDIDVLNAAYPSTPYIEDLSFYAESAHGDCQACSDYPVLPLVLSYTSTNGTDYEKTKYFLTCQKHYDMDYKKFVGKGVYKVYATGSQAEAIINMKKKKKSGSPIEPNAALKATIDLTEKEMSAVMKGLDFILPPPTLVKKAEIDSKDIQLYHSIYKYGPMKYHFVVFSDSKGNARKKMIESQKMNFHETFPQEMEDIDVYLLGSSFSLYEKR